MIRMGQNSEWRALSMVRSAYGIKWRIRLPLIVIISILIPFAGNTLYGQKASEKLEFTILHTNDEHSHLIPHPAVDDHPEFPDRAKGGIAGVAGTIDQIRQEKMRVGEPVLLFSAGDFLGGPAFGWLPLKDGISAEMSLFRQMGYDAVTIGNHEFDYGPEVLADYLNAAGYPDASGEMSLLSANIEPPPGHPLGDVGIEKTKIMTLENGLKLGLFGLIGNDAIRKSARKGEVRFRDPIESAREAVDALRAQGAEIIVAITHSGVREDRQLAEEVPGIHIIVGGHSHTQLFEPVRVGETIIVQAGEYLEHLGMIELRWDRDSERLMIRNQENDDPFLIPIGDSSETNAEVKLEVDKYEEILNTWVEALTDGRVQTVRQVIAESEFDLERAGSSESTIGNYITDAMKFTAERRAGIDVHAAVQANGAIRANIVTGSEEWSQNKISFYDMMMAASLGSGDDGKPGYPLVSFYLTGGELITALELSILLSQLLDNSYFLQLSGLRVRYDPDRSILFHIPFTGTPVPSRRAVLRAEVEMPDGSWNELNRGDKDLYHIVTDRYIAEFLPEVGNLLPGFSITLKNRSGEPVALDEAVMLSGNGELKVWESLLDYTYNFREVDGELATLPAEYKTAGDRVGFRDTVSLWVGPLALTAGVLFLLIYGWIRHRRKQKTNVT